MVPSVFIQSGTCVPVVCTNRGCGFCIWMIGPCAAGTAPQLSQEGTGGMMDIQGPAGTVTAPPQSEQVPTVVLMVYPFFWLRMLST